MVKPNGSLLKILGPIKEITLRKVLQGLTIGINFEVENLSMREITREIGHKGMDFFSCFDYCVCLQEEHNRYI